MDKPVIAVVGGETLLAKEVRELLTEQRPSPRLHMISAAEGASVVGINEEDPVVMTPLTSASLEGARVALLAGSESSSRRALKVNPEGGPSLIDLAGSLEEQPAARLRAPSAESGNSAGTVGIQVIAHPAAIALVMFLKSAAQLGSIRRAVAMVFEPASERGQRGLEELQKQTVAVLSFQKPPQDVYDTQVAFNMLAQYGEEAEEPLDGVEQRIERHVASLLSATPGIPMPSLRLVHAPVFHGYSISVWIEFEDRPGVARLAKVLEESGLDVRPEEPPNNVGVAGLGGVSIGGISEDRNHPRAYWCWLVADNLRLAAENAVAVAREFL